MSEHDDIHTSATAEPSWQGAIDRALVRRRWILVPSFLLGPESWAGVARVLERLRQDVVVTPSTRTTPQDPDHIEPWLQALVGAVPPPDDRPLVIVGHSATCPRQPLIVDRLMDLGHEVSSMILVNGRIPEDGVVPTEADSPFMDTLDALERPDGYLPPWHRWWGPMIEDMLPDDAARDRVLSEAKPVPRAVFDQPIPAPKLPGEVGLGFLALGEMYRPAFRQAREEGWAVTRLGGEHLHMVVDPVTVTGALVSLAGRAVGDAS